MLQQAPYTETWCDAENSKRQLGKDVKYKMLVSAIKQETGEEVAQLVSESFTVGPPSTSTHAYTSTYARKPCLDLDWPSHKRRAFAGPLQGLCRAFAGPLDGVWALSAHTACWGCASQHTLWIGHRCMHDNVPVSFTQHASSNCRVLCKVFEEVSQGLGHTVYTSRLLFNSKHKQLA